MKPLRYILYGLVILAAIGLLCYYAFWEKNLSSANITKCAVILVGAVAGILKSGVRRKPSNLKAIYQKAYSEFLENAFSDEPKLEKQLYQAIYDYNRSKPSNALSRLEKLRKQCQRTNDIYAVTVFLGLCYDDMGLFREAIGHYRAAVNLRSSSTVHSNLGLCYQKLGQFKDAETSYRQAILLDSKNQIAIHNLSDLYFRQGNYEASLALSKQVLEIDASMVQALSNAALCCALTGRNEEYETYYRLAVSNGYDGRKITAMLQWMRPEEDPI